MKRFLKMLLICCPGLLRHVVPRNDGRVGECLYRGSVQGAENRHKKRVVFLTEKDSLFGANQILYLNFNEKKSAEIWISTINIIIQWKKAIQNGG
jgi:hypothetical protein